MDGVLTWFEGVFRGGVFVLFFNWVEGYKRLCIFMIMFLVKYLRLVYFFVVLF